MAAYAVARGYAVDAVVATEASARRARSVGATSHVIDLDRDEAIVEAPDYLFYFAPPPREGTTDPRLQRLLCRLSDDNKPKASVYISTAGVYGNTDGAWVDEHTAVAPTTERAQRRLDAEQQMQRFDPSARILRAPGIYGPERVPVAAVCAGEPILADAEAGWRNRIHVDALADIAWCAGSVAWPAGVMNTSDGWPTTLGCYYDALADMLNVPHVPRIGWAEAQSRFSDMRLSFLRDSRRLDSRRLLDAFGRAPLYEDFHDGLVACRPGEL